MIHEVEGAILLSKAEAIAHGVAVNDDFKQGLALALRERWPSLYKDFRHYCQTRSPDEGSLWSWKGPGSQAIVSLLTQKPPLSQGQHPGKATLSNVSHCLKKLVEEVKENSYKSLAITKLATGVGGLDWEEVKPLLEKFLGPLEIPVYVYAKYVKNQSGE